jgi:high-affinity iron transporter
MSISAALQSGSILLREGLEAMLIIAVLAGALRKASAWSSIRALHAGAAVALAASLVGAVIFAVWYGGGHDDRVETVVMLVAAVLMFYMSGWLWLKQDGAALTASLRADAERALNKGAGWSIFALAFLAVFREGAETILFLHALANAEGGWNASILLGLGGAAAALALIYFAMQGLARRLPLRPVFVITSALLFVMGLRFVGAAVQELQEQQLLPYSLTPFGGVLEALGFNPTWEAFLPQVTIVALALAAGMMTKWRARAVALAE